MALPKQSKPILRIPAPIKEESGLGDAVKEVTTRLGFTPCGGCERRATILNRWIGFTPMNKGK